METLSQSVEPDLHPYERARLMVQVARPAFTRFTEETIASETDVYKSIRIEAEEPRELDIVAFGAGLGRYFRDDRYPRMQNLPVQKDAIRTLVSSCLGQMIESRDGGLVRFGVNDSLYFASIFSTVAATEVSDVMKEQGYEAEPVDLLRRPDFQALVEGLSYAPYEFYKEDAVRWPKDSGLKIADIILRNHSVGEPTFADVVKVNPDGSVGLNELVRQRLVDAVRRQNNHGFKSKTFAAAAPDRRITTAGCPVGMHPNAKDGNKTAIAQWCEYVADQYERYEQHVGFGRKLRAVNSMLMMSGGIMAVVKPVELYKPEHTVRVVSPGWKNETQVV